MSTPTRDSLSAELRGRIEHTIRFLAVDAVEGAKSGHPGAPMGLATAAFELWSAHLRFDPADPDWPLRDRFVLSNGHASMLVYSLLHLFGFDVSLDDLRAFRKLDSKTPGHPERGDTPGVEITTGPLGQGFAHGVGMALAGKMTAAQFGQGSGGPGHHFVYGIVSDGDLMEGISAEAGSIAGHLGLGNLIYLYDDNEVTIDGSTSLSFSEDVAGRFEAQGWQVISPVDGQDPEAVAAALSRGRADTERPTLIRLQTTIGLGSPNKAGTSSAHGSPLGADEVKATKEAQGWPLQPEFLVPDDVRTALGGLAAAKRAAREADDAALEAWRAANPDRAAAWDAARSRRMPENLAEQLAAGMDTEAATRTHSGTVLQRLSDLVPYLAGGSADLAGSAAPPLLGGVGNVEPGAGEARFAGRNLFFGIREHAMTAITNGINLDGTFIGYCGTFLIFSDYMRPAIRLAALMGTPSIYVLTHDSIFLGEDGPTHQPVEHLDALRAMPGLSVWRPADGLETALAYAAILEDAAGPSLLALSRQSLPPLARPAAFEPDDVRRGAYALVEPDRKPDVVLLASGSEVALACAAADKLLGEGVAVRVVSVPCLDVFLARPEAEQLALVPDDGTLIAAVEAGRGESYRRLVGRRGLIHGLDRFGASGPLRDLAERFGFTPDALAAAIRDRLA